MKRSKTVAIDVDNSERFDVDLPGKNTNTGCSGLVRIQVWKIQLHHWFDQAGLTEHLSIEGRRYRSDGGLFDLHVRATITRDELPHQWFREILALDAR